MNGINFHLNNIITHKFKYSHRNSTLYPLLVITFLGLLFGCKLPSFVSYENQDFNFSLEYPSNWEFLADERIENDFGLTTTDGILKKSSARIYILALVPIAEEPPIDIEIFLHNYLDSLLKRANQLKSFEVLQITDVVDKETYEMISATISVPTLDIAEDSFINQMGQRDENVSQTIDIYIFRNNLGQDIVVEVYKGTDTDLNAEADAIVKSFQFINE